MDKPKRVIVCEKATRRLAFIEEQHYPQVLIVETDAVHEFLLAHSDYCDR